LNDAYDDDSDDSAVEEVSDDETGKKESSGSFDMVDSMAAGYDEKNGTDEKKEKDMVDKSSLKTSCRKASNGTGMETEDSANNRNHDLMRGGTKRVPSVVTCDETSSICSDSLKSKAMTGDEYCDADIMTKQNGKNRGKRQRAKTTIGASKASSEPKQKKAKEDQTGFDIRLSFRPKESGPSSSDQSDDEEEQTTYTLTVMKDDEILAEDEVKICDVANGTIEKQVQYKNVALNLKFNLHVST